MSKGRSCFVRGVGKVLWELHIGGVHVSGCHILHYVVFYWKTCLFGGHVLLKGMYYRRAYLVV